MTENFKVFNLHSESEEEARSRFANLFKSVDLPDEDLMANLGLFIRRQLWARYLFMHELYTLSLPVHGVIMEFGVRWGQNLALLSALRGVYEPFNFTRTIVGFDTFTGAPAIASQDGSNWTDAEGAYSVSRGWKATLEKILEYHESESPLPHLRKFELVEGDVSTTLPVYLQDHPETIVALAYFDMDVYQPTYDALRELRPYLTIGSVIGFDEACFAVMPGETVAIREALGLDTIALRREPYSPTTCYLIWDGRP